MLDNFYKSWRKIYIVTIEYLFFINFLSAFQKWAKIAIGYQCFRLGSRSVKAICNFYSQIIIIDLNMYLFNANN